MIETTFPPPVPLRHIKHPAAIHEICFIATDTKEGEIQIL